MQRFLRFAVDREMAGDRDGLKEYTIGVEVFDRPPEFDPRIDSIVRVEARRLRKKLAQYYEGEGASSDVRITLPEGSYVPLVQCAQEPEPEPPAMEDLPEVVTLAVLPFRALPSGGEPSLFADGLTEELITSLSQLPGVRVIARSSVLRFAGQDGRAAGAELGVAKVIEGSVRVVGSQIKVTVQLVRVSDGLTEWGQGFLRELRDSFAVQEEIAAAVTQVVRRPLTGEAPKELHIVPGDAYQQLLEGRHFAAQMTPAGLRRSVEYFQRAIRLDPRFASGYAAVAGAVLQMGLFGNVSPATVIADAGQAIYKALQLNPELAAAHLWRAFLNAAFHWQWDEAEVDYQRALELNPNLVEARLYYAATVMNPQGRFAEARAHLGAAALLEPASPVLMTAMAMTDYFCGDLDSAIAQCRRAIEGNSEYYGAHRLMSEALLRRGQGAEAVRVLEEARPRAGADPRILASLGHVFGRVGEAERALEILEALTVSAGRSYVSFFDLALIHLGLDQREEACHLLVQCASVHEPWLAMIQVDPIFEPLRGMAEFDALVVRIFPSELE
jgi:TolB-like protein/tetratricopeptide (TPR) repeat protein